MPQAAMEAYYPTSVEDMKRELLLAIPNQTPGRDYEVFISCPEFTSVCPMTGLPDFGTIELRYTPDAYCVELKALKYYLLQYRNVGIFHESVTNRILTDLVETLQPKHIEVKGIFTARGGIATTVTAQWEKS